MKKGVVVILVLCIQTAIAQTPKLLDGKGVYTQYCLPCHQEDGTGVPNLNPPLRKSDWVNGDKNRLIKVILEGLEEEIEVNGESYNRVMAAHNFLTDKQVADVLTYIRSNFENTSDAIKEEEVKSLRKKKP
ncbi:cytochrome c [Emticicia sp. BO119]|uniref:c-type cytochrome n=1 Tax=Emticicia sp. BO119 TaxID=2757768 RepID=UPI0015F04E09|nr:cytochrome c [Emticicia sp. BO119]MBA4853294.1 cytochrome c [Emticicia sp. BO119]